MKLIYNERGPKYIAHPERLSPDEKDANGSCRKESLLTAQRKAEALFATVVERGMIRPGLTESELSLHIHELAKRRVRTAPHVAQAHRALGSEHDC
jgi:hypothetical protein